MSTISFSTTTLFGEHLPHNVAKLFENWLQTIDPKVGFPNLGGGECDMLVYLAK
jgi:hypothetical protein